MGVAIKEARSGLACALSYVDVVVLMWTVSTRAELSSKFVGHRTEGECREEKTDGRWTR